MAEFHGVTAAEDKRASPAAAAALTAAETGR
jgi:hypothetical protein